MPLVLIKGDAFINFVVLAKGITLCTYNGILYIHVLCFVLHFYRMLEEVSGSPHHQPTLSLAANLPSLKFHIDEHKVRMNELPSLLSLCLSV